MQTAKDLLLELRPGLDKDHKAALDACLAGKLDKLIGTVEYYKGEITTEESEAIDRALAFVRRVIAHAGTEPIAGALGRAFAWNDYYGGYFTHAWVGTLGRAGSRQLPWVIRVGVDGKMDVWHEFEKKVLKGTHNG